MKRPASQIFGALADPTRLQLLERLGDGRARATLELAQGTGISRQAVTKHLKVLHGAGLVHDSRSGRRRMWRLDPAPLRHVQDWTESLRVTWEQRFDQLDAFLENGDSDAP